MAVNLTSPIASYGKVCVHRFEQLCALFEDEKLQSRYEISLLQVHDSYGQFKIWASNIGALQSLPSSSSLDHRLREVPKLSEQVVNLLEDLGRSLEDVCVIASGERENRVSPFVQADVELLSINDEIDGTGTSTDPSSPVSEPLSEIREIFLSVSDAITSLFSLSILVRNNSSRDRYAKALVSASKAPLDDQFDIDHVGNKFPRLYRNDMAWLRVRLGKAITHRRQYLRYCREHHEKLAKAPAALHKGVASPELKIGINFLGVQGQPSRLFSDGDISISKPTSTLVSTTASTINPVKLENVDILERLGEEQADDRSQTSYATSVGEDGNDNRLSVVPLEEIAMPGQCFECPYCWTIQRFTHQNSWSKHVMRDLKPYVCTSEQCDLKLFADRHAWFTHELQNHLIEWRCCFCSYPPQQSLKEFQDHVRKKHADISADGQLPALTRACRQPIDRLSPTACPFCDEWEAALRKLNSHIPAATSLVVTVQQFRHHVGRHMEQLALFAIPRGYKENDDSGSSGPAPGCM
ncbi:hypothetical protein Egran_03437 [Elaphomyces granulatus]|uniref:Oxidoreductase acuF-like C2H2 type zinc-finger domain-containing protein n=1 Tax=Elaphomyces granulatus TaxID=519963 RepID=A0A232LXB0_9EURO|nr:hypothetical protein Egran_03437 [Elaphomyces granulatus]